MARIHTRRHHEVASSLRSGLDEVRGLYLHKALLIEVGPNLLCQSVSQRKRPLKRRPAEVEIAVLGPKVLTAVAILLDSERRGNALI